MSIEQLYALVKAAKESMLLQDQLNSATTADEVAAIAKNVGIIISAETIMKAQNVDRTVSEDELEGLSDGGNSPAELLGALLDRLKDEGKQLRWVPATNPSPSSFSISGWDPNI